MRITICEDDGSVWAIHELDSDTAAHLLAEVAPATGRALATDPGRPDTECDAAADAIVDDLMTAARRCLGDYEWGA